MFEPFLSASNTYLKSLPPALKQDSVLFSELIFIFLANESTKKEIFPQISQDF